MDSFHDDLRRIRHVQGDKRFAVDQLITVSCSIVMLLLECRGNFALEEQKEVVIDFKSFDKIRRNRIVCVV
jgi:hypothetical protein